MSIDGEQIKEIRIPFNVLFNNKKKVLDLA